MSGPWINPPSGRNAQTFDSPTFTGNIKGAEYAIAQWDIPIIQLSSGTMGNNGSVTGLTSIAHAFANCYVVLPAGAIATGVPAAEDVYFAQWTSATALTVFNNRLVDNLNSVGAPQIPASPTAFVTTGPGAFTGVTTARTLVTITVPAGAMGANGQVTIEEDHEWSTAATNKTVTIAFGGTNIANYTHTTTSLIERVVARVKNCGSASVQHATYDNLTGATTTIQPSTYPTVNTANAVAITFNFQKVTATENLIFQGGRVLNVYGA